MSEDAETTCRGRRDSDRALAREAVEALKTSDGWTSWLRSRRYFHRYSLANQLLIARQLPAATDVTGFRAWLKLGYCVRRGERALRIWMPIPPTKAALEQWQANGGARADRPGTRFRLGPVFDVSQVDPLPPPALPMPLDPPISPLEGDDLAWAFPGLVSVAGELGAGVLIERMPDARGGYLEPYSRRIALNRASSVNQQVKTLVHELSHALLRWEVETVGVSFSYSQEELVVESTAYTVCGSLGLDTSKYSIPYLASWSEAAGLKIIEQAARGRSTGWPSGSRTRSWANVEAPEGCGARWCRPPVHSPAHRP